MGLTIHYSLSFNPALTDAPGDVAEARRLIDVLHRRAKDLPFASVGPIVDLSGLATDADRYDREDPTRWLLIQAGRFIEQEGSHLRAEPTRLIAFTTLPGEGCESANFGLCRYPAAVLDAQGQKVPTKLSGWSWHSFCKTQYASNPDAGGAENFLRCHLSVIRLLDYAQELGILGGVTDESGYWNNRDVPALARTVGQWNTMMAGFVGRLKDQLGDRAGGEVQSAITQFPDYEHLEAKGRAGEAGDTDSGTADDSRE